MDGNKELPIGMAADEAVHIPLHESEEAPRAIVATDEKSARMLDSFPTLTSAYAAYIRARQVYVIDKDHDALLTAQDAVISAMRTVIEFVDQGAALTLGDSVIEVQFEVLNKLGMI